ncbi:MAG: PqqD family protein [Rivularia sp. (in: Bacteria)]|nr:PqqD family protein [Rivularia sp. MS3]
MNQTTSILNQKLSIPENVIAQELTGEIVILEMESESYYNLNSVASRIWELLTSLENVEASIQQLLQVYLVDEATLSQDVTNFADEFVQEGLLISSDNDSKKTDELNKSDRTESQKPESFDNRFPYEAPLLRKHGKVNDMTNAIFFPRVDDDGLFNYSDFS